VAGVYKIGVVSQRTGLSASTLRLWEDQYGLLAPARSKGGTRLYSESDLERIVYVRHLVRERGYALHAIAEIIDESASTLPNTPDRVAIENVYLRETANREQMEEGRRLAQVHAVGLRLIQSQSAGHAVKELVYGVATLGGVEVVTLGLYQPKQNMLRYIAMASGNTAELRYWPLQHVSKYPPQWQDALRAGQPYWCADLHRLDLPDEVGAAVREDRTRSFHAQPLSIGKQLVGILVLASRRPGAIPREARRVAAGVAVAAGPAIHYFARHL
jgi:DNA-binding transcriptional MerR regulator